MLVCYISPITKDNGIFLTLHLKNTSSYGKIFIWNNHVNTRSWPSILHKMGGDADGF